MIKLLLLLPWLVGVSANAGVGERIGVSVGAIVGVSAEVSYFPVPAGAHPHDVAPAADGGVWYTAQRQGALGHLDPATGKTRQLPLGPGSAPHGVIVDAAGNAWVTDSGLNALVRVAAGSEALTLYPLPATAPNANLNTAAIAGDGRVWFTGQSGFYGVVEPVSGRVKAWPAPRGRGPYGIAATPAGAIWYVSLAGNHLAQVNHDTGAATPIDPPTANQGARRVWSDSKGRLWISEWLSGQVSVYDPAGPRWRQWRLPGAQPRAYAVYVDERDVVWLSDFAANAIVAFHPDTETFTAYPSDKPGASVRQLLGRPGEVWGAESGTDRLVRIRYGTAP